MENATRVLLKLHTQSMSYFLVGALSTNYTQYCHTMHMSSLTRTDRYR